MMSAFQKHAPFIDEALFLSSKLLPFAFSHMLENFEVFLSSPFLRITHPFLT